MSAAEDRDLGTGRPVWLDGRLPVISVKTLTRPIKCRPYAFLIFIT